ncbi:MAG: DUF488 family protein [Proteobacteria bacterium]|nr:DUF488 family protein [Pseudomonadota bacterium]
MWRVANDAEFVRRYTDQLAGLDPWKVADELVCRSGGRSLALLCYERPSEGKLCHRGLVASWLSAGLGQPVTEIGYEDCPLGSHPLLSGKRDQT